MKPSKELEALVVSTLASMPAEQFLRTLKAGLDGRRRTLGHEQTKEKPKKKKLHWKTKLRLEREKAEKNK